MVICTNNKDNYTRVRDKETLGKVGNLAGILHIYTRVRDKEKQEENMEKNW